METIYLDLSFRASQIEAVCKDAELLRAIEVVHNECKRQWLYDNHIDKDYLTTLRVLVEIGENKYPTK